MNRSLLMVDGRTLAGHPKDSQVNPTPGESSRRTSMVFAGDTLQVLGRNALGEAIVDTPVIPDDKFYVRTAGHVWAFG